MISSYNSRYLTSFTGTTGSAMITLGKAFSVTDFRYTEQAAKQATGFTIVKNTGYIFDEAADSTERLQSGNLTFEETQVSFTDYNLLGEILPCELVPVVGLIKELRKAKDEEEVVIIEKACTIVDQGSAFVLEMTKPGTTETEAANQLNFFTRSKGASGVSFETTMAGGLCSVMPHGVASHKVVEKGELTTLDFGCHYEGYASDMTRTFAIGSIRPKLEEIYDIVLEAQLRVLAETKLGLTDIQLNAVARDYIASYGYNDTLDHSIGHDVGLEIHEGLGIPSRADEQFVPENVIMDEPGIYLPGIGGACIEDNLLVTAEGSHVLTHAPKELIIL